MARFKFAWVVSVSMLALQACGGSGGSSGGTPGGVTPPESAKDGGNPATPSPVVIDPRVKLCEWLIKEKLRPNDGLQFSTEITREESKTSYYASRYKTRIVSVCASGRERVVFVTEGWSAQFNRDGSALQYEYEWKLDLSEKGARESFTYLSNRINDYDTLVSERDLSYAQVAVTIARDSLTFDLTGPGKSRDYKRSWEVPIFASKIKLTRGPVGAKFTYKSEFYTFAGITVPH